MLGKHESGVCSSPGPEPSSLDSGNIFYNAYELMPQRQPRHPQPLPPPPLKFHLVSVLLLKAGSAGPAPSEGGMSLCYCHIDLEESPASARAPADLSWSRTHLAPHKVRTRRQGSPRRGQNPLPRCPPEWPGVTNGGPQSRQCE